VPDATEHARISALLEATFAYSVAWPSVVENIGSGLVYFPVNCLLGASDPTLTLLMSGIEHSVRAGTYLSIKRPLSWCKALDSLTELACPVISLSSPMEIIL
jgi:hypothetical protein